MSENPAKDMIETLEAMLADAKAAFEPGDIDGGNYKLAIGAAIYALQRLQAADEKCR